MMSANGELTSLKTYTRSNIVIYVSQRKRMLLSSSSKPAERGLRHSKGSGCVAVSFELYIKLQSQNVMDFKSACNKLHVSEFGNITQ